MGSPLPRHRKSPVWGKLRQGEGAELCTPALHTHLPRTPALHTRSSRQREHKALPSAGSAQHQLGSPPPRRLDLPPHRFATPAIATCPGRHDGTRVSPFPAPSSHPGKRSHGMRAPRLSVPQFPHHPNDCRPFVSTGLWTIKAADGGGGPTSLPPPRQEETATSSPAGLELEGFHATKRPSASAETRLTGESDGGSLAVASPKKLPVGCSGGRGGPCPAAGRRGEGGGQECRQRCRQEGYYCLPRRPHCTMGSGCAEACGGSSPTSLRPPHSLCYGPPQGT